MTDSGAPTKKMEFPPGWRWVKLGEVCEINPRRPTLIRNDFTLTSFVPMSAVDDVNGVIAWPETRHYGEIKKGYTYFVENDVVFAKITPCMENGKQAIARNLIDGIGFGSTEFHVIRPNNNIIAEWIWYFVRQPSLRKIATNYFTGAVGQQRVPDNFLKSLQIPLPPFAEQQLIAARLNEQMAAVAQARQAAEEQLRAVKELPAAYLREVFPASGKSLPVGWRWVRLGEVCDTTSGGTPPRGNLDCYGGDIPWVKSGELNDGLITSSEETITETGLRNSSAKLFPPSTLLIALYGATVGKLGILGMAASTNQAVCAIFIGEEINKNFLFYYLFWKRNDLLKMSFGGAQPNINQEIVRSIEIPLPPLAEQQRIAARLNEQMAAVAPARQAAEEQLTEINNLPAALLRQAFSGGLS